MTPQQLKWIVDHMGHTLDIHNIHYSCTSDIIERSDVAKLLMLMDRKQMGYFKNKKLEEISLEGKCLAVFLDIIHLKQNHGKKHLVNVIQIDTNYMRRIFLL